MITVKDYAKSRNVSYVAVTNQIKRYDKELKSHISVQNRTRYLDDEAVQFLDAHRMQRTVIVEAGEDEAQKIIDELKTQVIDLQSQVMQLKEQLLMQTQANNNLLSEKMLMIEDKTRTEMMLEQAQNERDQAEKEAASYVRTFFGFYKKSK